MFTDIICQNLTVNRETACGKLSHACGNCLDYINLKSS